MADHVGFEVDFLPVGNGDRSGDAIAIRYGITGNYKTLVYDGGTKEAGQELVDHIKRYYGTNRVDYVVNSHPDGDHASGLSVLLEQLQVGQLWMHRPWRYSSVILDYLKDGRITDKSLAERLKEEMASAYALEEIAVQRRIPVFEPFRGSRIDIFFVLSPEQNWYVHDLIPEFEKSPEQKKAEGRAAQGLAGEVLKLLKEAATGAVSWIADQWNVEYLREDVETSAENESSVILFGEFAGHGIMLTGDAGIQALTAATDYTESNGVSLPHILRFIQVPHHGSRHNVSTRVLDRIVGPRKPTDDGVTTKTAFVSAGKESSTHPRKMVINAFCRRGAGVYNTKGQTIWHHQDMPLRQHFYSLTPLPFSSQVEAWD